VILSDKMIARISLCLAVAALLSGCDKEPTSPTPTACTNTAISIGLFGNGSPASPGQGQVWTTYFAGNVLPAAAAVYVVDVIFSPSGCVAPTWTAVSADRTGVQVSPASGTGNGQVELFIPGNDGGQRSTRVTIANQTATITQSGR
jgi:hypothetical protein